MAGLLCEIAALAFVGTGLVCTFLGEWAAAGSFYAAAGIWFVASRTVD